MAESYMLSSVNKSYIEHVVQDFSKQRDALLEAINASPYLQAIKPIGGIFSIIRAPINDMWDFAEYLAGDFHADGETLLISPASSFYFKSEHLGSNQLRLPFTDAPSDIKKYVKMLDEAIESYECQIQTKEKKVAMA